MVVVVCLVGKVLLSVNGWNRCIHLMVCCSCSMVMLGSGMWSPVGEMYGVPSTGDESLVVW